MIYKKIEAIFLDHGNTMRVVVEDEVFQNDAQQQLVKLIGTNESPDTFCKQLDERYSTYKKRVKETLCKIPRRKYGHAGCCRIIQPM